MKNPAIPLRIQAIQPTIFFRSSQEGLLQKILISLDAFQELSDVTVLIEWDKNRYQTTIQTVPAGKQTIPIFIPDIQLTTDVQITLIQQGLMIDTLTIKWKPIRHWEVHLVHGSHHDLGYTDLPSNILKEHSQFIDEVLDICDATDQWDSNSQFRYQIEQAWSLLYYLQNCSEAQSARLIQRIKENRIEVTALMGNETTELCGHEELIRLLYPSFRLHRLYGIDIVSAELNDIPGVAWGLISVLAGSGIKYFSPALPDYYGWGRKYRPWWDEKAVLPRDRAGAFWWEGPDRQKVLVWHEGGSIGWTSLWSYEQAQTDLAQKLAYLTEKDYPYAMLRIKFHSGMRDNSPPDARLSLICRQWNEEWAYPRLIVSTNRSFFQQFEQVYGSSLPILRGDLPNTDYHIGAYSTARETAINRQTHDLILAAEKFATCAAMITTHPYPAETLAEAYESMLMFDEHTWGMAHPTGPGQDACWAQKAQFSYRAKALAHDVLVKSTNLIADQITIDQEGYHIIVFNPLSYPVTGIVSVQAVPDSPCSHPMYWQYPRDPSQDKNPILLASGVIGRDQLGLSIELLKKPFSIQDLSTGSIVTHQIRQLEFTSAQPDASSRYALSQVDPFSVDVLNYSEAEKYEVIFIANDVPPLGYKTYRIVTETSPALASIDPIESHAAQTGKPNPDRNTHQLPEDNHSIENEWYRISLDKEGKEIISIYDKELKMELVDTNTQFHLNQIVARKPKTGEWTTSTIRSISIKKGKLFDHLAITASCEGCPQINQEVILYHDVKQIDFHTKLLRDSYAPLEIFCAFPFAIDQPEFSYESNYGVNRPILDQLPGTNTDSYTIQHWLKVQDKEKAVTFCGLDAAVVYLGKLWSGSVSQAHLAALPPDVGRNFLRDPKLFEKGHIFSLMMINNFRTNFSPIQTGECLFRYSITSSPTTAHFPWRFGWLASQNLQTVILNQAQSGSLPDQASFLQLSEPDSHLLTMKAAEDGDGLILRLANFLDHPRTVNITLPFYTIKKAHLTNLIEDNMEDLPSGQHRVKAFLPAGKIITIRCQGKSFPSVKNSLKL